MGRKKKDSDVDVVEFLVRKEFQLVGADYDTEIKKNGWESNFYFGSGQHEEWKTFCVNYFRTKQKMSKKSAENAFSWLDLAYGFSDK